MEKDKEKVDCLCCRSSDSIYWSSENGYTAVKCVNCGLIYVNPRPAQSLISEAVKTGVHRDVSHGRTAIAKHEKSKVKLYRKILSYMFADVWCSNQKVAWLDVGAGYGEVIEAVSSLAPFGSKIVGLEPMKPKVEHAKSRGLMLREEYLNEVKDKFDYLSLINVYSHIPDFQDFLQDVSKVLNEDGEVFLETGNTADLISPNDVPGDLDLPDHLVFAGEKHLIQQLENAGFSIIYIYHRRVDGFINFIKNIIKKILGRKINVQLPYTSSYRTLLIRAKRIAPKI